VFEWLIVRMFVHSVDWPFVFFPESF